MTPLMFAALWCVETMSKAEALVKDLASYKTKWTEIEARQLDLVKYLVKEKKADKNAKAVYGRRAIHFAV